MKCFKIISVISILLMGLNSVAQDIVFDWPYSIYRTSGFGSQNVVKLDMDADRNIYVMGTFSGTVQFDYNSSSESRTSNGSLDCYILKLSPSGDFLWVKTFGGIGMDRISDGFVFDDQSLYVTGDFRDTIDIDPSSNVYNITTPSQYDDEIFVLKLDTAGNFIWAKDFGSHYSNEIASCITADSEEYVYVGGGFQDTVDFDPGIGVTELISVGGFDAFIQKLDSDGNFIWVKQFGAASNDLIKRISTDENRNVYATGTFEGTVDFDPGVGSHILSSVGNADVFIQKLDKEGDFVFAQSFGGTGSERMNDMFIKDEFIYSTGMFFNTVDFDGSANIDYKTSAGLGDIYIHKMDTSGTFQWVKTMGSTGYDESLGIYADSAHNVFSCGLFSYNTDFDPGPSEEIISTSYSKEQFVHKLDSSGAFEWVYPILNFGNRDNPNDLIVDDSKNVTIGGLNYEGVDLDIGPDLAYVSGGGSSSANAFVYKLKECNNSSYTEVVQACDSYTWINGVTYTSSTNSPVHYLTNAEGCDSIVSLDLTISVSTTGTDSISTCSAYTWIDGVTYNSSNNSATHVITNAEGCDSIVSLDLTINSSYSTIDYLEACESYTWIDGNTYFSSNNTATHLLNTIHGCDSLVTLDLIINNVSDLTITSEDTILIANNTGANYQWLRCDNNMLPIWSATNDTFFVLENGDYAVVIAENGCVDTSQCITVNTLNLPSSKHVNKFKYYPNPTDDKVYIETEEPAMVSVYDIAGRVLKTPQKKDKNLTIDLSEHEPGIYIFYLHYNNRIENFKVVLK